MSNEETAELDELDIDKLGHQMLTALEAVGGESNSKLLRRELEDVEPSSFNYRLTTYLEPLGLVETHQPEVKPGNIPPKEITLTEKGKEFLNETPVGGDENDLRSRIEHLEDRVETLTQENQELRNTNEELKSALEQQSGGDMVGELERVRSDLNGLESQVSRVESDLNSVQNKAVVDTDIAANLINAAFVQANACKVLLREELTEEEVEQKVTEVKQRLSEKGELIS